jgi:hypothetical protein
MDPMALYHMVVSSHRPHADRRLSIEAERWRSPAAGSRSDAGAKAGGSQVQCLVRCCAGVEARSMGSVAQEPRAYGQICGVIPFSCAYLAADASTSGRTSA